MSEEKKMTYEELVKLLKDSNASAAVLRERIAEYKLTKPKRGRGRPVGRKRLSMTFSLPVEQVEDLMSMADQIGMNQSDAMEIIVKHYFSTKE